jgi:hypothetical protein
MSIATQDEFSERKLVSQIRREGAEVEETNETHERIPVEPKFEVPPNTEI